MQHRMTSTQPAQPRHGRQRPLHAVNVLVALQADVVTEPLRLLVGVRVAPDVRQQRRVVHDRADVVVQAQPLGKPDRDQALAHNVLHRLTEPEIDTQRQRSHELRQTNRLKVGAVGHGDVKATRVADRQAPGAAGATDRRRRVGTTKSGVPERARSGSEEAGDARSRK